MGPSLSLTPFCRPVAPGWSDRERERARESEGEIERARERERESASKREKESERARVLEARTTTRRAASFPLRINDP